MLERLLPMVMNIVLPLPTLPCHCTQKTALAPPSLLSTPQRPHNPHISAKYIKVISNKLNKKRSYWPIDLSVELSQPPYSYRIMCNFYWAQRSMQYDLFWALKLMASYKKWKRFSHIYSEWREPDPRSTSAVCTTYDLFLTLKWTAVADSLDGFRSYNPKETSCDEFLV